MDAVTVTQPSTPTEINRLHFACGAVYEVTAEPLKNKAGNLAHLLVYVQGRDKPESPKLDGKEMNCLYLCPCATKGKRKEQRAWVGDAAIKPTGEPVRCVTCRPTHVTRHPNDGTERRLPPPQTDNNNQTANGGSRSLQ